MKPSTPYSAKDIERYHSGQLSVAERHALEKAALDDPFLADALEGYAFTKTPSADMASLKKRLEQRINQKDDTKKIFYIGYSWMKIAALFILFAGGGWLVFKTFSDNKTELATTPSAQKNSSVVTPEIVTDSDHVDSDAPVTTETAAAKKENETSDFSTQNSNRLWVHKDPNSKDVTTPPATFSQALKDSSNEGKVFSEEVATLRNDKTADTDAKSIAIAKEGNQAARISSTDTIKNFDVVLQPTNVAVDEVVVLNKKTKLNAPRQRMQMLVDTLEPAEGWPFFDNYIASNIKTPTEVKAKPISGEVELSFDVNKQGEPVNITVTKSLCSKCDQEAIRLLKEGPKWNTKAKKGKVKIKF